MTRDELRAEVPELAGFVDGLRAKGFNVMLRHIKFDDGREVGREPVDEPNVCTQDWTHAPSLYEVAASAWKGRR